MKYVTASSGQNPVPSSPGVSYNVWGLPTGVTFSSGDSNNFQYDSATGRMTQYQASVNGSSMTGVLTWNANGSLRQLAITDPFNSNNAQTCTYVHDDLGRIGAVNCGTGKWNQSFSYGSNGFGNVNWTGSGIGTSFTQAYDTASNHFQSLGSYNANGALTSDGTLVPVREPGRLASIQEPSPCAERGRTRTYESPAGSRLSRNL